MSSVFLLSILIFSIFYMWKKYFWIVCGLFKGCFIRLSCSQTCATVCVRECVHICVCVCAYARARARVVHVCFCVCFFLHVFVCMRHNNFSEPTGLVSVMKLPQVVRFAKSCRHHNYCMMSCNNDKIETLARYAKKPIN